MSEGCRRDSVMTEGGGTVTWSGGLGCHQQRQGRSRRAALLSVIVQLDLTIASKQLKLSFCHFRKYQIVLVKYFLNNPANINMEGAAAGTSRETFLG